MIVCLEIGNNELFGGVYVDGKITLQFSKDINNSTSADELAIFLRAVIRENGLEPDKVRQFAYCSVVPDFNYTVNSCVRKYFNIDPFSLKPGVKTGLKIKYSNPSELGADRIAAAIGAYTHKPKQNVIIVNFGTATTFDVISKDKTYLGGAILPGMKTAMQSLEEKTAKLPVVEILQTPKSCGKTTVENIQSGLFYGQLGAIKEITARIKEEVFSKDKSIIVATGIFSELYKDYKIFDVIIPSLLLDGVYKANGFNNVNPRPI
ncbi:MAG: type III pantothenate kinase [Desulfotalea sp.]